MAYEFDADEMQYILFLTTFYTDITCDALSKTFKHWYRRDVSPLAIKLFHRKVKIEEPDGSFKDSLFIWALLGFQSPASVTQIQALARYRMMHDLAIGLLEGSFQYDTPSERYPQC